MSWDIMNCQKKLRAILSFFGPESQKKKFVEELKELAEALEETEQLYDDHVIEEMADVAIMFNQYVMAIKDRDILKSVDDLSTAKFGSYVNQKIRRTMKRILESKGGYCPCKHECETVGGADTFPSHQTSEETKNE